MQLSDFLGNIRQWILTSSDLSDSDVIWSHQSRKRPSVGETSPFITTQLMDIRPQGIPYEYQTDFDITRSGENGVPGTEIEFTAPSPTQIDLRISCYGGSRIGSDDPMTILHQVQHSLALSTFRDPLAASGISPYDEGRIQYIPAILNTDFEQRAVLDMSCYVTTTMTERATYIDSFTVSGIIYYAGTSIGVGPFTFSE